MTGEEIFHHDLNAFRLDTMTKTKPMKRANPPMVLKIIAAIHRSLKELTFASWGFAWS